MAWMKKHAVPLLGTLLVGMVAAGILMAVNARHALPFINPKSPTEGG